MMHKTKATMQGRLSHNVLLKRNQVTRLTAGGQNFTQRNFAPADFVQLLWRNSKVSFAYKSLILPFFLTLGEKVRVSSSTIWLVGCRQICREGSKAQIRALAYSDSLVMIQIFGIPRLYIWFLIFFSRFLNSFLSSSSSAFNALYFSGIPFSFIAEIANCSSFVSLRSGGNIESGLPVISAVVCLQSTVAGQSHVIPICPAISNTTTSYRSVLLLLSAENLYSIVFLRSGACSLIASVQPFGSIPCLRNSALANSFSQLPRLTPSLVAAAFSCSRSSGAIRIWKVGDQPSPFCDLSRLIVDTYVRNLIVWFLLRTYVITMDVMKTTPRTVGAVPRRLTKPLMGVTVMAGSQHTQTRPKYQYRFLALNRHDKQAKPCRLSVEAATEREARRILAPHFILSLAARLPVMEARYV